MIVNNKMAFFSDALGHSALTGIAIGMMFGIANTNISMIIFAIIFSIILNYVKHKTSYGADTIITATKAIASDTISFVVIPSTSPTKYDEYWLKLPCADNIASPKAIAIEENTLIIVSAP